MRRFSTAGLWFGAHRFRAGVVAFLLVTVVTVVAVSLAADKQKDEGESLALRYAETYLKLTKVTLAEARRTNTQVPGTVPVAVLQQYEGDIVVAEELVDGMCKRVRDFGFGAYLRLAKAAAVAAQSKWDRARRVNASTPGTYSDLRVERLRLQAELARIKLDEGLSLQGASRERQDEWKLQFLFGEVIHLNKQIRRLTVRNP